MTVPHPSLQGVTDTAAGEHLSERSSGGRNEDDHTGTEDSRLQLLAETTQRESLVPNQKGCSKPGADQEGHVLVSQKGSRGQHPIGEGGDCLCRQRLEHRISRYEQNGKKDRQYGRQESWQPGFGLGQNFLQLLIVDPQSRSGRYVQAAIEDSGQPQPHGGGEQPQQKAESDRGAQGQTLRGEILDHQEWTGCRGNQGVSDRPPGANSENIQNKVLPGAKAQGAGQRNEQEEYGVEEHGNGQEVAAAQEGYRRTFLP